MKFNYDAIIIGSGIGGLASAASLAKNGYKVIILEKLHQPGGYLNTFKRGDYWFEGSTHQIGGFDNSLYLERTLKDLGIKLPLIKLDYSYESITFDKINKDIIDRHLIKAKRNNAINSLEKASGCCQDEIKKVLKLYKNIAVESLKIRNQSKKNKRVELLLKKYKNFNKYKEKNYTELLALISNEKIKFLLSQYCYYFMVSAPAYCPAGTMSNFIYQLILRNPTFIKGGTKTLVNECLRIINKNNSEIKYKQNVKSIILDKRKAIGIKTINGDEYFAKSIISNVNAFSTYNDLILDKTIFDFDNKDKVEKYKSSKSAFQIYLGLPFNLKEYGFKASTTFFSNSINFDEVSEEDCSNPEFDSFYFTNYSSMDPDFSPEGKSSILITEFDNKFKFWSNMDSKSYKIEKGKKQNIILKKLKDITGLPVEKAEICFSATPKTMHFYSGKVDGGVLGLEKKMENNKFKNKTSIENLYIVGADTTSSGGITSTFDSGIVAANYIMKG